MFILNEKSKIYKNTLEQSNDKLKDLVYLSILYDFYGELLGEHNRKIFEDYILNDFSLSEIADVAGISRQGVHDIIKRCSIKLKGYEDKLHLVEKFENVKIKVDTIKELSKQLKEEKNFEIIINIEQISQEILNEL